MTDCGLNSLRARTLPKLRYRSRLIAVVTL